MDATDLLGKRAPLIDRGDHFDWSDLFGWGFGVGGDVILLRS